MQELGNVIEIEQVKSAMEISKRIMTLCAEHTVHEVALYDTKTSAAPWSGLTETYFIITILVRFPAEAMASHPAPSRPENTVQRYLVTGFRHLGYSITSLSRYGLMHHPYREIPIHIPGFF